MPPSPENFLNPRKRGAEQGLHRTRQTLGGAAQQGSPRQRLSALIQHWAVGGSWFIRKIGSAQFLDDFCLLISSCWVKRHFLKHSYLYTHRANLNFHAFISFFLNYKIRFEELDTKKLKDTKLLQTLWFCPVSKFWTQQRVFIKSNAKTETKWTGLKILKQNSTQFTQDQWNSTSRKECWHPPNFYQNSQRSSVPNDLYQEIIQ